MAIASHGVKPLPSGMGSVKKIKAENKEAEQRGCIINTHF